jgi:peptidoglycan LD-endopeptidase CwlK
MIISRDKNLLCPAFAAVLTEFERLLAIDHLPFYLFMGLRDWQTQDELYAQGRTAPGPIVTNAKGGQSWHNYALAADYVLDGMADKPGIQWSWDTKHGLDKQWIAMGEIAELVGLEWGGRWRRFPDLPHVQMTGGLTIQEAQELYRMSGIKEVWKQVRAS